MTLITMQEAGYEATALREADDVGDTSGHVARHECDNLCMAFVRERSVRRALELLYEPKGFMTRRPSGMPASKYSTTAAIWARLKVETFEFVKHGSTSFILRARADEESGAEFVAALKCVLLPYSSIASIADETLRYVQRYNAKDVYGRDVRHMVHVRASCERWILMDFVPGRTLAEEIQFQASEFDRVPARTLIGSRFRSLYGNVRLDILRRLGLPLLTALNELHQSGRIHEDLSPSNIMVESVTEPNGENRYEFTFIDFGRNYLYSRVTSGLEPFQGQYVAPEVRENVELKPDERWRSDAYSFGRIMISLGNVSFNDDGTVPDRFYAQSPLIARMIEDLVAARPAQRLLVFSSVGASDRPYDRLRRLLHQELDATQAAISPRGEVRHNQVPFDKDTIGGALGELIPLSREPKRRLRIFRIRREQGFIADPRRSFYARWLLGFSLVASVSCYLSGLVCLLWLLRDFGIGILNPVGEAAFKAFGLTQAWIPGIDDLRVSGYDLGNIEDNLPARIIGITFALAAGRYYQNVLGGFTTRVAATHRLPGAWRRNATEFICRIMSFWGMPLILGCNLVNVAWWPIASAIGYTGVLLSNVSASSFAYDYIARAQEKRISTVPARLRVITGLSNFRQWGPSMFFYVLIVWGFALPIYYGIFLDVYVYAIVVGLVNFGLFYIIKTGANALDIRTGLTRAVFAAERLRLIEETAVESSGSPGRNPAPVIA
jgi:serine/threonine protein kinase